MTEDRLEGIDYFLGTQRLLHPQRGTDYLPRSDMIWLVEQAREAERLPGAQVTIGKLSHEIARLRELLGRLEWAGTYCGPAGREMACCPVCEVVADSDAVGQLPHRDCWLDKELHVHDQPTRPE